MNDTGEPPTVEFSPVTLRNPRAMNYRLGIKAKGSTDVVWLGFVTDTQLMMGERFSVDWDAVRAKHPELWGG